MFKQVVVALAHEIVAFSIEGDVMRVAQGRTPCSTRYLEPRGFTRASRFSWLAHLCANPLPVGASASIAVFGNRRARWKVLSAQPTGTPVSCYAGGVVPHRSFRTIATFFALGVSFWLFYHRSAGWLACSGSTRHVNSSSGAFHC